MKSGNENPNRYGMIISYFFLWQAGSKLKLEQELLFQSFALEDAQQEIDKEEALNEPAINDEWFGKFKGMNVIMIQLESFQQFLLHHRVEGQEITPFLNRLAKENMEFTEIYNQFGMGHTSDAELAALHSLYPLKNEIVNYKHYEKQYYGFPKIMRSRGYTAEAFHGYKGDFYNRRTMMNTHGFERFYCEDDYLNTDRVSFGISDHSFFEQSGKKNKSNETAFFSFMISLSSHFPFHLEEKHWGLNISKSLSEEFLGQYYQSVNYTDRALKHFFDCLKAEGLLSNTVIALYGDHEGVTPEHTPALFRQLGIRRRGNFK